MVKLKILYPTASADSETAKSFTFELFLKANDNVLPKSIRGLEVVIVTRI
jgi:hypothetical protein